MSWEKVKLFDICRPKQWKTISTNNLESSGFPVYGANGKIGFYNIYTHEFPTLAITCRGATCGSLHITEPKSYINGNAMALDNLSPTVSIKYLYYSLKTRGFHDVISGSAQPQITREGLEKIEIPLPPLPIQEKIAAILDKADALRRKDQELLKKYDELAQAIFIDMFGDPVRNEKGWEVKRLSELGTVVTGNTPPRANDKNYGDYIEWIKTDNILLEKVYPVKAKEYLSESGSKLGRIVSSNSILVTCIAGSKKSIGNCCLTDRTVAFNQQINAFKNFDQFYKPIFLYRLFKEYQSYIQNSATDGMKKIITKSEFEKLAFIVPPLDLQETFAKKIELIHQLKAQANAVKSEELFQTLLQRAFKGQLMR